MTWTIYYNPKCSKCRAGLSLLEENQVQAEVIDYLNNPPSMERLRELARKLNLRPKDFVRQGEPVFASLGLNLEDDEAVLAAIHQHPILLERPIVELEGEAIIGRPPERVAEFLAAHLTRKS